MEEKNLSASQVHTNCFCLIFFPLGILICYFSFCFVSKLPEYRKKNKPAKHWVENWTKWKTKHFPSLSVVWALLRLGASKSLRHFEANQYLYETADSSQLGKTKSIPRVSYPCKAESHWWDQHRNLSCFQPYSTSRRTQEAPRSSRMSLQDLCQPRARLQTGHRECLDMPIPHHETVPCTEPSDNAKSKI